MGESAGAGELTSASDSMSPAEEDRVLQPAPDRVTVRTEQSPEEIPSSLPAGDMAPSSSPHGGPSTAAPSGDIPAASTRPVTRSQHGIRKEKVYTDGTVKYGMLTSSGEPYDLTEALQNKNWKEAMLSEYDALMKNKTWHLVPPQKGRNVIGCK